ncbi:MAG TPA: ABC transporter permease [Jiangellaceae bacterium]|nr:ABC transporter permease [Jiangellaceae bacterium]
MTTHSAAYWAASDSMTMIRRSMRHSLRDLESLLISVMLPIMLMLLFVYVFGGAIDVGTEYVNYVVPGIILLCAGYGASTTALSVSTDMHTGVIDRFRSLPIVGSAVLTGHVVASMARNAFSTLVVVAVALLVGFRPEASALGYVGALAMVLLFVLALSWVSVVVGLVANSVEAAGAFSFFILFLPYVSSAFVPPDTMPAILHGFADHQPVTPMIETIRALLMGTPAGDSTWTAVAWFGAVAVLSFVASMSLFRRSRSH